MHNIKAAAPGSHWSNRQADGKLFKNIGASGPLQFPVCRLIAWQCDRLWNCRPHPPQGGYKSFSEQWFRPCNMAYELDNLRADPATAALDHAFWVGHATTLLCLSSGTNIIFDPVFSNRCSPFTWAGPARRNPPATSIDELPPVHIVTVSHNHYDHLDEASVLALHARFPEASFVVPLGLEDHLVKMGIKAAVITSMDWQDEVCLRDVVIACTPAEHWGKRWLNDNNKVLWCGWHVGWKQSAHDDSPAPEPQAVTTDWKSLKSYYFTGDTSWNEDVFRCIQARHDHVDMAALPIGAYSPRDIMSPQHIDPEHAVLIFKTLNAKRAFGVHWATFELTDEPLDEPPEVLRATAAQQGLSPEQFITMPIGCHVSF